MLITHSMKQDLALTLSRGLFGLCPHCGKGKLFARYLKQVDHCPVCGERFGHIRADDGPAWLTIILVGHILAPIMLMIGPDSPFPDWALLTGFLLSATGLSLLILPRAKGIFIGLIWRNNGPGIQA